jgi:cyclopropane fatty-acyl-phospholipid synthase-like methyltransferase
LSTRYGETLSAGALESPAAERNKQPILEVLARYLPAAGTVLEIASGTGQHIVHFARALPALTWQPTDVDPDLRASASARIRAAGLSNVREPIALDVHDARWPSSAADAVVCINMIHIAPWSATPALMRGSGDLLPAGAPLVLYGPFRRGGLHTAASNEAFDESLRRRNADWGVRDLADVEACAGEHGFELAEVVAMPANNLTVVFERVTRPVRSGAG